MLKIIGILNLQLNVDCLQEVSFFVTRCYDVVKLVVQQMSALYTAEKCVGSYLLIVRAGSTVLVSNTSLS